METLIPVLTSLLIALTLVAVPDEENSDPRLKLIERNVFDSDLEPDLRKIAINDLSGLGSEAAQSILVRAIQSADEAVALGTLEAIAEMNAPPRGVIEPITERWLRNGNTALATPLLSALTRYGADSVELLEASCGTERPLEQRRRAVFALSVFAGGEGANALIALANSEDHEDIRLEVFDGLRSLWSRLAPNKPITTNLSNPQAWIPILTPNGSECRLENQRRLEAEQERERISAVLMESRATIYNLIPESERADQLRIDLASEVASIRRASMIRIDERLRDGISPTEKIANALMTALDDSNEPNKVLAASILSKVNPETTAIALASRLEQQRTSVIQEWGVHLIRTPVKEAALPALGLLRNQVGSEEIGVGVLLAIERNSSLRDLFDNRQRSSLQDWLARYLSNGAPTPEAIKLQARLGGENFRSNLRTQLQSPDQRRSSDAAWGLAELGAIEDLGPRSRGTFQIEPWLTACLNHSPGTGFVDYAFVSDLLNEQQLNQLIGMKLKPKWELAVVYLARRTNPEFLYEIDLSLEKVLGMEAVRVRRELFDQEHWDQWILPRMAEAPMQRDMSVRNVARALVRAGRSGDATSLVNNLVNSESIKNDMLLEIALRQEYWNTAESRENKSDWIRVLSNCAATDQQIAPALVELSKEVGKGGGALNIGPIVDHLESAVLLALKENTKSSAKFSVWEPVIDKLSSSVQSQWVERMTELNPTKDPISASSSPSLEEINPPNGAGKAGGADGTRENKKPEQGSTDESQTQSETRPPPTANPVTPADPERS